MAKMSSPYPIKFDEEIYEKVKKLAKSEHRSIANEIEYIISKYIEHYEEIHGVIDVDIDL